MRSRALLTIFCERVTLPGEFDPVALLRCLTDHGVDFIVIGGFAAWMHGAPVVTMDVDIVYSASFPNVSRLVKALEELHACYRQQCGRRLVPSAAGLSATEAAGHHLLETQHGNLDVLRTVVELGYEDLLADSLLLEIDGSTSRFASLERIIRLKEAANRPKDVAALPTLRAALNDIKKST